MPDCIFCKIINKEIPSEVVYEGNFLIVFKDVNPKAKYHFLVVPKEHISSVNEIDKGKIELAGKMIYQARKVAEQFRFAKSGYKLVFNCGKDGGQVVDHLHLHLLGGGPLGE